MSSEHGAKKHRHNPVESIRRKIKYIQMMDQVSNPALRIPRFQSQNYDVPKCNIKKCLEEILKKRTFRSHGSTGPQLISPNSDSIFSASLQLPSPCLRHTSDSCSANATHSIIKSEERSSNSWMLIYTRENCPLSYFMSREANTRNKLCPLSNIESEDVPHDQKYLASSPSLYFFTSDKKSESAMIQSPVSKRSPLSKRGWKQSLGYEADNVYDESLICEDDLLTAVFCACDTECTGKAAVSRIVDYLRHTTNRGLEDSGLGELCSMLDPDQKDVSVDLETYRAIMKKWIEDRKRKRKGGATEEPRASVEDLEFKVLEYSSEAKETHDWMNVTSGSLEAFGGDVSKGDMETSDLLIWVSDLQWNSQQLQEENKKLKLTLEDLDETINKLLGDNELLCQQLKSPQHSVLKAKSLEEDLEEAKNKLNLSEEKRQQLLCRNTQLEKEIQSLVDKITSLQEENIRNSMDTDRLEKKILELCKNASDLQSQARIYESLVVKKEASLIQKEQDIKELKLTIVEYSSTIETLRAEKKNLVENMQDMQQELISNGLSFPLLGKCNSDIPEGTNSLHCELELAQPSEAQISEPDGSEWSDKFKRRSSSWGRLGAKPNEKRPSLQRFISTYSWAECEDEHSETKSEQSESPAEVQEELSRKESISEKGKYSSKWNLESVCKLVSEWASHFKTSFSNANKTLWVSVSILVLLVALTSFLTGLSLQRPADAAPVGTGASWTLVQKLLWPYTELRHNGPPPV